MRRSLSLLLAALVACGSTDGGSGSGDDAADGNDDGADGGTTSSADGDDGGPGSSGGGGPSGGPDTSGGEDTAGPATTGAGDLPDCSFDAGLAWEPDGPILQLESADQSVCVRIERRNDGPGTMANTSWTLLDIRVGPLGQVAHVDAATALCWFSSHHNFTDWAHAWTDGRHYDVKLREDGHGGPRTYELHTFASGPTNPASCAPLADGTDPIGDPIELFPLM